jgi:hypothetical protein
MRASRGGDGSGPAARRPRERKPWSVPRLRGRGEQGNIVMHTELLSALYVRTMPLHIQERGITANLPYP